MPKVKMMQSAVLIRGHMNRAIKVIFVLHCIHAESIKVAATNRLSMVAAFAFALVTSSYPIKGSMRAARYKALVGAYCNISLAISKMSRN